MRMYVRMRNSQKIFWGKKSATAAAASAQAWGISYLHDASPEVNQMAQPFIPNLAGYPTYSHTM